jgi:hypothetical protein
VIGHSEDLAMLDEQVGHGARTYLSFGPAPVNELVRVLAQHLEMRDRQPIHAAVMAMVSAGELHYSGSAMVSLPAGGDTRDTEEQS